MAAIRRSDHWIYQSLNIKFCLWNNLEAEGVNNHSEMAQGASVVVFKPRVNFENLGKPSGHHRQLFGSSSEIFERVWGRFGKSSEDRLSSKDFGSSAETRNASSHLQKNSCSFRKTSGHLRKALVVFRYVSVWFLLSRPFFSLFHQESPLQQRWFKYRALLRLCSFHVRVE